MRKEEALMKCVTKGISLVFIVSALILVFAAGCTIARYRHEIVTKYDASGNVIGTEDKVSITQSEPFLQPFKVKVTKRDKIEDWIIEIEPKLDVKDQAGEDIFLPLGIVGFHMASVLKA